MGRKGSGRPKESYKPLSEVFEGIHEDILDLDRAFYKRTNALRAKVRHHYNKFKLIERKNKHARSRRH